MPSIERTRLENFEDPKVGQLVEELCQPLGWQADDYDRMSFFDFLVLWGNKGGARIKSDHFPIEGVWSVRISDLPESQLRACLVAVGRIKGQSLEPHADRKVFKLLKSWFHPDGDADPEDYTVSSVSAEVQIIKQRRRNGDL